MLQTTTDTQLALFPEWDSQQDFVKSYQWVNNANACYTVKEDIIKPAFKDLRAKDYICRMNFLCCGTCASSELFNQCKERGKLATIYWHKQDQERMVDERSVFFGYGSVDEKILSSEDVGRHLVDSLRAYINHSGLPIEIIWDGSTKNRIQLSW